MLELKYSEEVQHTSDNITTVRRTEQESDTTFELCQNEIDPLKKCYLFDREQQKFYEQSIKIEVGRQRVVLLRKEAEGQEENEQKFFDLKKI